MREEEEEAELGWEAVYQADDRKRSRVPRCKLRYSFQSSFDAQKPTERRCGGLLSGHDWISAHAEPLN